MSEVMRTRQGGSTVIKPCPFCGYDQCDVYYHSGFGTLTAWVYCPNCDAHGPHEAMPIDMSEREAAIDAWNDRRFA